MTDKQRAALVIDGIGLDGWDVVFGLKSEGGGFDIFKDDEDQHYKLSTIAGISKGSVQNFQLTIRCRDERIEFLMDHFFFGNYKHIRRSYRFISTPEYRTVSDEEASNYTSDIDEKLKIAIPIWRRHYQQQIEPMIERFKNLKELHDYDEPLSLRKSLFKQSIFERRLILKRLVMEEAYRTYITEVFNRYEPFLKDPDLKDRDKVIGDFEKINQLISHLNTLDVEEYLLSKPWQGDRHDTNSYSSNFSNRAPIYREKLSIVLINKSLTRDEFSTVLGLALTDKGQATASDAMIMDQSDEIYIMTDQDRTMIFLQDITAVSTWNWSNISKTNRVMAFMIMEGATMNYHIAYWDHGQCLLSRMESDEILVQDYGTEQEKYIGMDTMSVIRDLFKNAAGRELSEVYDNEVVTKYSIS
jgi:hypothetical protein